MLCALYQGSIIQTCVENFKFKIKQQTEVLNIIAVLSYDNRIWIMLILVLNWANFIVQCTMSSLIRYRINMIYGITHATGWL